MQSSQGPESTNSRILECIDNVLRELGDGPAEIIYASARRSFNVSKDGIVSEPKQFEEALQSILGAAGTLVESKITCLLIEEFGLAGEFSKRRLHRAITEIESTSSHSMPEHERTVFPRIDKPSRTKKYRSQPEIIDCILRSIKSGSTKTHIIYRCYLSYVQMKEYLALLEDRKLIFLEPGTRLYKLTENGVRFMNAYDKINELISEPVPLVKRDNSLADLR